MSELIRAEGLGYRVGPATLVAEVDLTAEGGELVGVVGPNGAGKSTLLRLIGGDLSPWTGSVALAGESLTDLPPDELALMRSVFSDTGSHDIPFTVRAVVALGRHPHRRNAANTHALDDAAVASALARTDTAHLANRTFSTLSSGERTRVSLSRVLAQETPIVLLNEPTVGLDVAHRERVMAEFRRVAASDKAVVAVLHDLNAAAHYADRLLLIASGHVVAEGTPQEVLDASLLSEVYDQPMAVVPHPFRDCPLVLPSDRAEPS